MPEAHIGTWHKARRPVLGRRQTQGVITTHALQTLAARGRHAIGWDEILEGDIPQDAIIMSWRGVDGAIEGTGKGHHVVLSPASYCYLDYYQSPDQALEPMAWGGYVPVSRTYRLDPTEGMTPEQSKLVLGPQVNLWTEYIDNYPKSGIHGAPAHVGPGRGGMDSAIDARLQRIFPKECRPSGVCIMRAATITHAIWPMSTPASLPTTMPAK